MTEELDIVYEKPSATTAEAKQKTNIQLPPTKRFPEGLSIECNELVIVGANGSGKTPLARA